MFSLSYRCLYFVLLGLFGLSATSRAHSQSVTVPAFWFGHSFLESRKSLTGRERPEKVGPTPRHKQHESRLNARALGRHTLSPSISNGAISRRAFLKGSAFADASCAVGAPTIAGLNPPYRYRSGRRRLWQVVCFSTRARVHQGRPARCLVSGKLPRQFRRRDSHDSRDLWSVACSVRADGRSRSSGRSTNSLLPEDPHWFSGSL